MNLFHVKQLKRNATGVFHPEFALDKSKTQSSLNNTPEKKDSEAWKSKVKEKTYRPQKVLIFMNEEEMKRQCLLEYKIYGNIHAFFFWKPNNREICFQSTFIRRNRQNKHLLAIRSVFPAYS